ncbi:MAG TPA: hypothetical protein PLT76_08305 [Candidatus Omnitrophota bacterium]|nr:hypothetical protein [Candidatus Omnitrophota bacterium]HPB67402.1 hypothetical protein [Candidatus Omnitrophota bacterium]HQO58702.1 hypothetical protein [Candidatus Omnitrophota bacterium]
MEKEINIIYTNGQRVYKLYTVKQYPNGIYHFFKCKGTKGFHFSYHKDGNCHITDNKDHSKAGEYKSIPIGEINGVYSLVTINGGVDNKMNKIYEEYTGGKLINPILIDSRFMGSKSDISINLSLLKAEDVGLLNSEYFKINADSKYSILHIATNINPWVVIHIRSMKD